MNQFNGKTAEPFEVAGFSNEGANSETFSEEGVDEVASNKSRRTCDKGGQERDTENSEKLFTKLGPGKTFSGAMRSVLSGDVVVAEHAVRGDMIFGLKLTDEPYE